MNREILETYLNIVKTRSLSKTAECMFISQSTVSNRLIGLENELKFHLINRSPGQREIVLTQRGTEFIEYAKRYLELEQQISAWGKRETTSILRVASVISLTDHLFKGFYRQLLNNERLSLILSTHWTDRIISMLESYEVDVGITPRVFYSKAVDSTMLFEEPLYFVSNIKSEYPDNISPQSLNRSKEIYFDWGTNYIEWHDSQINPLIPPLIVSDTTEVISELLQIPEAYCIMPASVYKSIANKMLKISRIFPPPPSRTCYLLKRRSSYASQEKETAYFEKELRTYLSLQSDLVLY